MTEEATPSQETAKATIMVSLYPNKILCNFLGDIKGRDISRVLGQIVKQYRIWKMKLAKEKK